MSLLMEALRKAEQAKRSTGDRSGIDTGTETTRAGPDDSVFADRGQSDSERISGTYPALDTEDDAPDTDSPDNLTRTSQDQQSANALFLAKQIARRRQQQRQRMAVLLGLLVLLPVAGACTFSGRPGWPHQAASRHRPLWPALRRGNISVPQRLPPTVRQLP